MEFIGELVGASKDVISGKYNVVFATNELPNSINDTYGPLKVVAKKNRHKRSLDANNYAWLIISKIADILGTSKEAVYSDLILKYGQPYVTEDGQTKVISVLDSIDVSDFGLYVKCIGKGHIDEKVFNHYVVFRGSHTYDTKEMSIFIDGVVSEAKEMKIDTVPIVDLEKMKARWHL